MPPLDHYDAEFAAFFEGRLRPAIDDVARRRSRSLWLSVAVGVAVAVLFAGVSYLVLSPYTDTLAAHDITYWPLFVFVPASIGVIAFSAAYILGLRSVVGGFRRELMTRLAEHIGPGIRIDDGRPVPAADLENCLLFSPDAAPLAGKDSFRVQAGAAAAAFCDVRLASGGGGTAKKDAGGGLFFQAEYPARFRSFLLSVPADGTVSVSGLTTALRAAGELDGELVRLGASGRQIAVPAAGQGLAPALLGGVEWENAVAALAGRGIQTLASFRGRTLTLVMLSRRERLDLPGAFDGFDFGNCREFCRCARACLAFARETGGKAAAFE